MSIPIANRQQAAKKPSIENPECIAKEHCATLIAGESGYEQLYGVNLAHPESLVQK